MPVAYIPRTRELYASYAPYRWVVNEDAPWTPLTKPLSKCKVALISSGGIHHKDQIPFHSKDDISYYRIPRGVNIKDLRISHFGYRTDDAQKDPNCVFPIERLRELEAEGVIGEFADPAYTFMGGIYSARKVREELAPRIVEELTASRIDLFYLVPA
jgi:D-proline reductase (dithiol) PrdB